MTEQRIIPSLEIKPPIVKPGEFDKFGDHPPRVARMRHQSGVWQAVDLSPYYALRLVQEAVDMDPALSRIPGLETTPAAIAFQRQQLAGTCSGFGLDLAELDGPYQRIRRASAVHALRTAPQDEAMRGLSFAERITLFQRAELERILTWTSRDIRSPRVLINHAKGVTDGWRWYHVVRAEQGILEIPPNEEMLILRLMELIPQTYPMERRGPGETKDHVFKSRDEALAAVTAHNPGVLYVLNSFQPAEAIGHIDPDVRDIVVGPGKPEAVEIKTVVAGKVARILQGLSLDIRYIRQLEAECQKQLGCGISDLRIMVDITGQKVFVFVDYATQRARVVDHFELPLEHDGQLEDHHGTKPGRPRKRYHHKGFKKGS